MRVNAVHHLRHVQLPADGSAEHVMEPQAANLTQEGGRRGPLTVAFPTWTAKRKKEAITDSSWHFTRICPSGNYPFAAGMVTGSVRNRKRLLAKTRITLRCGFAGKRLHLLCFHIPVKRSP